MYQTCCIVDKKLFTTNVAVFYKVMEDQKYHYSDPFHRTFD